MRSPSNRLFKFYGLLLVLFVAKMGFAQPVITSFTPGGTVAGGVMTITGTGFNTTASNNAVMIGNRAVGVTAATATAITVQLPSYYVFGQVKVLNKATGRQGISQQFFSTRFAPAKNSVTLNDFSLVNNFPSGIGGGIMQGLVSIDLDGDNKPEVIALGSGEIAIYPNTSTAGTVSFGTPVVKSVAGNPVRMVPADFDGDGRQDIVISQQSSPNGFSIWLNTGDIATFASTAFVAASWGQALAAGDINADGKPEVIMSYGSGSNGQVIIYPNNSTPGSVDFTAGATSFLVGELVSSVAVTDLTNDGMPEMVVARVPASPGDLAIYKNVGTANTSISSSFFNVASTAAPNQLISTTPLVYFNLTLADLDGDGKTDVLGGNSTTLNAYRNTYANDGNVSLSATPVSVTFPASINQISVGDVTGDGKPDVLASKYTTLGGGYRLDVVPNQSVSGTIAFGTLIQYAADVTPKHNEAVDLDGDGRPEIICINDSRNLTVYRNIMAPPVITSFTPTSGLPTATDITITGSGFNTTMANNIVYIGNMKAMVSAASATSLTVRLANGQNGAAYGPIVVTNMDNNLTAISSSYFLPGIQTPKAILTTGDLTSQGEILTFSAPRVWGMISGDLSGDGKPDLVISDNLSGGSLSNTTQVFINNSTTGGNISFTGNAKITIPGGYNTLATPTLADIDGDGALDVVSAAGFMNASGTGISADVVILRNQGTGALTTTGGVFPVGAGASTTSAVDIDGDGRTDVMVINYQARTASMLRNLSTGSGNINFDGKIDYNITSGTVTGTLADLDGDGKPDLVALLTNGSGIEIRANNSVPGVISFGSVQSLTSVAGPSLLQTVDIDGDGKLDLVVGTGNTGQTNVSIYRNTSSGVGNFSFAPVEFVPVNDKQQGLTVGDLNGDGKPDLAVGLSTAPYFVALRNTSTAGAISFDADERLFLSQPANFGHSHAIADFNNDGVNDLLVGNTNQARVNVYRGSMQFPPTITGLTATSGAVGALLTITGTNFNPLAANNIVSFGAVTATVTTASSGVSVSVRIPANASYGPIVVTNTANSLSGQSDAFFRPVHASNKSTLAATDFTLNTSIPGASPGAGLAVVDLDGDRKPDIADAINGSGNTVFYRKNNTTAASIVYGSPITMNHAAYTTTENLKAKDFNGDGKPDLVFADINTDALLVVAGTGNLATLTHTGSLAAGDAPFEVDAGDIDGDGRMDLIAGNRASNTISIYRNITSSSGQVAFAPKQDVSTSTTQPLNTRLADFDGDGKPDLITGGNSSGGNIELQVYKNIGTSMGTFVFDTPISVFVAATGNTANTIEIGDLDNDGRPDIIAGVNGSQHVFVLRNTGSPGSMSFDAVQAITIPVSGDVRDLSIGDVNGDGKADIIATFTSTPANLVILPNTTAAPGPVSVGTHIVLPITLGATGKNLVQDVNGDGRPDLFSVDYDTHTIEIYRNTLIAPPATQASNLNVTMTAGSATLSWTNGSGEKRAVFVTAGNSGTAAPALNTAYTANSAVFSGTQIGATGWYCVYNGTGNTTTITHLTPSQEYRAMVIEYNDGGLTATEQYNLTTAANNPVNFTAIATLNTISITTLTSTVNTATVDYRVSFGSAVVGLSASNFSLSATGSISGASVAAVAGSGTTFTVTVNTGNGDGLLTLNLVNTGGFTPALSNSLPFAGQSYNIDKTPPMLSPVSIASNNAITAIAKPGDQVTLSFTSSEAIQTPNVTIAGAAAAVTHTGGNNWTASYTPTNAATDGVIAFNIQFADLVNNAGTPVTTSTNSSSVLFDKTAPVLNTVTLTSSNGDATRARTGDVVTVTFVSSETIATPTVTIAGHAATPTAVGNNWMASYTMTAADAEGSIAFQVSFSDVAGNAGTTVSLTTNSSNVVFDKTSPTLNPVVIGSSNAHAAIAKPGDVITLSFTSSKTIATPTVTIATHTATLTHTGNNWKASYTMAPGDAEGAVPFSITFSDVTGNAGATVITTTNSSNVVFDKTSPALNMVTIASSNARAGKAKPGDVITLSFTANETIATPTVTIATHTATLTNTGNSWKANYTLNTADAEGVVPFSIQFADLAGNTGLSATATTNNSSILFDRTVPVLSVVGILSSNNDRTLAKVADTVFVTFMASEILATPTVTLATHAAILATTDAQQWRAYYVLTATDVEGAVPLAIRITDLAGNSPATITGVTDNSKVMFDQTAPMLSFVSTASGNSDTTLARPGQTITLRFNASETISKPTVTLAGHTVAATTTGGNKWVATYAMQNSDAEGQVTFKIQYKDTTGNTGVDVTSPTNNSAVVYGKIKRYFSNGANQSLQLCANTATALNALLAVMDSTTGETITWKIVSQPAHGTLTGFNATATTTGGLLTPTGLSYIPATNYTGTDVFSVQISDTIITTIRVMVNAVPSALLTSTGTIVCAGSTLTLTAGGGNSYRWYKEDVLINGATAQQLTVNTPGVYSVIATSAAGCEPAVAAKITITLVQPPKADFTPDPYSCANLPLLFTNTSHVLNSGSVRYSWTDGNGGTSSAVSPSFTYSNAGNYTVKLKIIPDACAVLADSITRTISISNAAAGIRLPATDVVKDAFTTLQARVLPNASYSWQPTTYLANPVVANPIVRPLQQQQYTIAMKMPNGCVVTDTLLVRVQTRSGALLPNVFTPNGDGQNDKLMPNLVSLRSLYAFRVFNRWGKMLFETNNPGVGWDGKYNGALQPMDTYTWVVEGIDNNGTLIKKTRIGNTDPLNKNPNTELMKQVSDRLTKSAYCALLAVVMVMMGMRAAKAQDPHFAQFFASPMTLNPALIGKNVSDWRALATYRSQWQGEGTQPFTTTTVSVEKNLSKNDKNILGVGMMFLSDASNNGLLKNNYLSAGVAYNNALDAAGKQYFGGGLTVNYASRMLDVNKFRFQSQFGSEGFDPTLPSNDYASIPNNHYIDVNAGLHYSIQSERSGFYTGLSYFHAAGPQDGLSQKFTIDPRLSMQAGYQYYFANRSMLHVGGLYEKQGQNNAYTLGLLYKQPVTESALGLRSINIGAWNRFGDAVSVYFGFESNSWLLGVTYDAITSKINSIQSLQSLEFSFGILFGKKKANEASRGVLVY